MKYIYLLLIPLFFIVSSTLAQSNTFIGSINSDWNNGVNWSLLFVPVSSDDVIIDADVILDTNVTVNNLTVNSGRTLQLSSYNITVNGVTTNNGAIDDDDEGGANTFHEIINNGDFTTTSLTGDFSYFFNGDITNTGNFSLVGGNPQCQFNTPLTIYNNTISNGNIKFSTNFATGTCAINADVTIGAGTSSGDVVLPGIVTIDLGKTLLNNYILGRLETYTITGFGILKNNQTIHYLSSTPPLVTTFNNNIGSTFIYAALCNIQGAIYHNLILKSVNTTSLLLEDITVNGDLTIETTRALEANNFDIDIKGDWINRGTFTSGTGGKVLFNGASGEQIIEGSTVFYNLKINKPSDNVRLVSLISATDITVTNVLELNSGKVVIGDSDLIFKNSTFASSSSYVVTNGTGSLISTSDTAFPVGSISEYQQVELSNVASNAKVRFDNTTTISGGGVGSWFVDNGSIDAQVVFLNAQGGMLDANSKVYHNNGAIWDELDTQYSSMIPAYNTTNDFIFTSGEEEFAIFTAPTSSFITTWVTTDTEITIPTTGTGYNYNIIWTNLTNIGVGNGSTTGQTGSYTITGLANGDTYEVAITGDFPRIYFNNGGDKDKILTIEQWGDIAWTSMESAFYGCSNLMYTATDIPNLSVVISLQEMFASCINFDGNNTIDNWNVSNVQDFSRLFQNARAFNQILNSWDVSTGTNFGRMFQNASDFDQPLSNWIFSTNILDNINMQAMFSGATDFNQSLNSWNVDRVTNMYQMFLGTTLFNGDISSWQVGNVTTMSSMFQNAASFNQDLDTWDVSATTNMYRMFFGATLFNGDISNWQVGNVTNMQRMFEATSFNRDIGAWDMRQVSTLNQMFSGSPFNQNLNAWVFNSATDFNRMFENATSFNNGEPSGASTNPLTWTFNVLPTDFSQMFVGASSFNQDLGSWDISNVTDMSQMLNNTGIDQSTYDAILTSWAAQTLNPNVNLGANGLTYCAFAAHNSLTSVSNNWTITGDAIDVSCLPTQPLGNRGMYFDGTAATSEYVDLGTGLNSEFSANFTIMGWIKRKRAGIGEDNLLSNCNTGNNQGMSLAVQDDDINFTFANIAVATVPGVITESNKWYHLAATYDGANMRVYLNGVLQVTESNNTFPVSSSSTLKIGYSDYFDIHMNGQIDEVKIFSEALNAGQIQTTMTSINTAETDLVGYWNFEIGTGPEVIDQLGNNNGILMNSPLWTLRVKNTNDSGIESLRDVIEDANALAGKNYVDFSIENVGIHVIDITSTALPGITESILIDGTSQFGYSSYDPQIQITTALTSSGVLYINEAPNSEIYGLQISYTGTNFSVDGIYIGNTISANEFKIGAVDKGNIINGAGRYGIFVSGANDGLIQGNRIGTNISGTTAVANGSTGISLNNSNNILIGGALAGEANLISGNGLNGISIQNSTGNQIIGNLIGTDALGTTGIGNISSGITILGTPFTGTATIVENVIAYNTNAIQIYSIDKNLITQNSIYNNVSGIVLTGTPAGNIDKEAPVIDIAIPTTVSGTCDCAVGETIELFRDNTTPLPNKQGEEYLGYSIITTANTWSMTSPFNETLVAGDFLTATITDSDGNTSPFSVAKEILSTNEIEIRNEAYLASNEIVSGAVASGYTVYGTQAVCSGNTQKHFRIYNIGGTDLTIDSIFFSGIDSNDFYLLSTPTYPFIIPSGDYYQFHIAFAPLASGNRTATINITNDDSDESIYTFDLEGMGDAAPEINLVGNAISIIDGDTTPDINDDTGFGDVATNKTITYTIENTGTVDLNIGSIALTDATNFSIGTPPTNIPSGTSATFDVTFTPTTLGTINTVIIINNDDCDEGIYDFAIQGIKTKSITLGTITSTNYCAEEIISIPFTTTGTFNTGNTFTAQLSDATGDFTTPIATQIGPSPILLTIPTTATASSLYKVRIVSSDPILDSDESADITVNPLPTAGLIASQTTICSTDNITFTATGGTNYDFRINSVSVQNSTADTYSTTTLNDTDVVDVIVTDVNSCSATSSSITITVNPLPTATLTASQTTICSTDNVIFTATGGTNYDFRINSVSVQNSTADTYSTTTLNDTDVVDVIVTDANSCSATSSSITITVNPLPTVTLSTVNTSTCSSSTIDFLASASPTGTYTYEFYLNSTLMQSSNSDTFTGTGLSTGDLVEVIALDANCSASDALTVGATVDTQVPTLTAMLDFTRDTDATNCYYTNTNTTTSTRISNGTATDNCGVASYSYILTGATTADISSLEGIDFEIGITTVTWTATDISGNISVSDEFTVTVIDTQNPTIEAPENITELSNLYGCTFTRDSLDIGVPIASDNCLFRTFNDAPTEFPIGETIVTWTAIDSAGNTSTAEQIITIEEQYYVIPSDSLILVQIYNQMGGTAWNTTWNLNNSVSTWNGITVSCGAVASINLANNNLTGTLPSSVLNLSRRTEGDFLLNIGGNRLNFESAEDYVAAITNFIYSPQAKIYAPRTEIIRESESITFTSQTEGDFNNYQWYKDQNPINGATNESYIITSTVPSDAGIYVCEITNTQATRLILERNPITLEVEGFVNPTDSLALVEIFIETDGENWLDSWNLTQPVATWQGVTLSGGKIRELDLSSRNLTGTLPNVFDDDFFSELRYLSFFDNELEGQIPTSIGDITTLTYLDLDKNNFEGAVPASFGNLVNLQSLWLSRNNLTTIPDEIGNMTNLKTLYLNDNKFTEFPETIGNLTELLILNVSDNELLNLPNSITNLSKLIEFYANRNYITVIPTDIQNLIVLSVFEINENNITELPSGFLQLTSLSKFRIIENELEFDDLLPYINQNYSVFDYAPQAPINEEEEILTELNSSISFTIQTQGNGNNYQWFRDETSIATTQNFSINRVTNDDVGVYTAQITNSNLPDLTLQRRSITLNVECPADLELEINQPTQTTFCENQPFGLKLEIAEEFTDIQEISWKKDGVTLAFANEITYTVTSEGIYTAEILTQEGCMIASNSVEITLIPQPEISIDLVDERVFTSTLNSQEVVTYQWIKDGNVIENTSENTYTPTETGEYNLLVLTELGCSAISETIIFTQTITGIEEPEELRNLTIFPNPNAGNFFVDFGTNTPNGEPTFVLIDAIGRKIILKTERISSTRYKANTNNLTGGMYYIQIQTQDGIAFRKFIIEE